MLLLPCFLNMADMSKFSFLATDSFCFGGITGWLKMLEIFAFLRVAYTVHWKLNTVAIVSLFIAHNTWRREPNNEWDCLERNYSKKSVYGTLVIQTSGYIEQQ